MDENKMKFYTISDTYLDFLRTIEPKIPLNKKDYETQPKPYVGVILTIDEHQYFAPLASYKPEKYDKIHNHTIYKIYGDSREEKLSVIHLNNMFPIIQTEIEYMEFSNYDDKYKVLLEKEYSFIISKQEDIKRKAKKLYDDVINEKPFFKKLSNDFKLLETEYKNFSK
ncbi:type III toxin-antitoxin system ToxN/AbiQ family toxin [Alkalibacillus almallahensis]|uniref:type III toxin-antitoxin system ToxN/AbiQ family toxin n=1 Tax=Alkalibacillus almallahensis TaxID=1379154 RepID=UPI0014206CB6|nr:type III toxin-antitoxin system ToxN/AbiQ family toxin [Alkalibacillus almallahensis]NIK13480.1 protein AbiQ [Alkalibacillus almallahensis]